MNAVARQAALDGKCGKKGRPVVAYAVALAAALSVESPFVHVDNITVRLSSPGVLPCLACCSFSLMPCAFKQNN